MNSRIVSFLIILACLVVAPRVQADSSVTVYETNNNKVTGTSITADAGGVLTLISEKAGGSTKRTFAAGTYKRVVTPIPGEVAKAQKAFEAGNFDEILKVATPSVMAQHKYLGWGATIAYLRGMAYIGKEDYKTAETTLRDGMPFAKMEEKEALLQQGIVQALYKQGKIEPARKMLDEITGGDQDTMAFVYNMRGHFLSEQDKKREAVLKHLTVILIFKDAPKPTRLDSFKEAISLLKALNDGRAGALQKMMEAEG